MTATVKERSEAVCATHQRHYGHSREQIIRHDRTVAIAEARQVLGTLLYYWAGMTTIETAWYMQRDHSSTLHGMRVVIGRARSPEADTARALRNAIGAILVPCAWTPPVKTRDHDGVRDLLLALRQLAASGRADEAVVARRTQSATRQERAESAYWKARMRQRAREGGAVQQWGTVYRPNVQKATA